MMDNYEMLRTTTAILESYRNSLQNGEEGPYQMARPFEALKGVVRQLDNAGNPLASEGKDLIKDAYDLIKEKSAYVKGKTSVGLYAQPKHYNRSIKAQTEWSAENKDELEKIILRELEFLGKLQVSHREVA